MKPITNLALVAFLASALFFACKNEPKSTPPPLSETTLPTAPAAPKPEVYLYAVKFDKLNLREQSNKDAKVLTQFAEGEFVEGTGEVSANKEEVTLRDVPYNEPYYKVTSTKAGQPGGWAYSAALERIYAGPRGTAPDLNRLAQLTAFLKTLNVKKLDSGKKAMDFVVQNFGNAQGSLSDASFVLLESFLSRMETEGEFYTMTEKLQWEDPDYDAIAKGTFDMNKYPATKSLAENGFRLDQGEGMIYPTVDLSKLGAIFLTKVSTPMKAYLDQSILEQKAKLWDDGGILIPLEDVADRSAFWEKFNHDNPYFVRNEETKEEERYLREALVTGEDNTPVFGSEDGTVSPEFKKVWAYVQQKYAGTQLGKTVKEMSDLCNAEGGKRTKKVEEWQEKLTEAGR